MEFHDALRHCDGPDAVHVIHGVYIGCLSEAVSVLQVTHGADEADD
jgi:hypothetical protein